MIVPRIKPLAAAILLACGSAAWANDYAGLFVFGDSLSDAGAFTNLVGPNANRFTTNPGTVWAQNLGSRYGLAVTPGFALNPLTAQFAATGGNDYAVGGARNTGTPGVFSLSAPNEALGSAIAGNIPPIASQVSTHLGQVNGTANPRALYAIWSGANDIFYQAGIVGAMGTSVLPQALTAVGTAAGDEIAQIGALRAAGARNIVVIGLPDMGATPYGQANPATVGTLLSQFSMVYNNTLVQGLASAGITSIAYLDPRPILADIQARPAAWGVTNTTIPACGAISSLGCGPAQQLPNSGNFLFADGVHPSAYTHAIISDWVYSSLEAPAGATQLGIMAGESIEGHWRVLDDRFRLMDGSNASSGLRVFASGDYASGDHQTSTGSAKSFTVGLEKQWGTMTAGLAIGVANGDSSLDAIGFGIDYDSATLAGYLGQRYANAYVGAVVGVSSLTFDTRRSFGALANAGRATGNLFSAKVGGAYEFHLGSFTHGPVAELMMSTVDIDEFSEAGVSSLHYGAQSRDSLRHRIGWQIGTRIALASGSIAPYARLTHEQEHKSIDSTVATGLAGTPFSYTMPYANQNDGYGLVTAGASIAFGKATAHIGLSTTIDRKGGDQQTVSAGLTIPF
jgi:outer membrane lipase/esterase